MVSINKENYIKWLRRNFFNVQIVGKKYNTLMNVLEDDNFYIDDEKTEPDESYWYYVCHLISNIDCPVTIHAYDKNLYPYARSHNSIKNNVTVIRKDYNKDKEEYQYVIEFIPEKVTIKTMDSTLFKLVKVRYQVFYHKKEKK